MNMCWEWRAVTTAAPDEWLGTCSSCYPQPFAHAGLWVKSFGAHRFDFHVLWDLRPLRFEDWAVPFGGLWLFVSHKATGRLYRGLLGRLQA